MLHATPGRNQWHCGRTSASHARAGAHACMPPFLRTQRRGRGAAEGKSRICRGRQQTRAVTMQGVRGRGHLGTPCSYRRAHPIQSWRRPIPSKHSSAVQTRRIRGSPCGPAAPGRPASAFRLPACVGWCRGIAQPVSGAASVATSRSRWPAEGGRMAAMQAPRTPFAAPMPAFSRGPRVSFILRIAGLLAASYSALPACCLAHAPAERRRARRSRTASSLRVRYNHLAAFGRQKYYTPTALHIPPRRPMGRQRPPMHVLTWFGATAW